MMIIPSPQRGDRYLIVPAGWRNLAPDQLLNMTYEAVCMAAVTRYVYVKATGETAPRSYDRATGEQTSGGYSLLVPASPDLLDLWQSVRQTASKKPSDLDERKHAFKQRLVEIADSVGTKEETIYANH